MAWTRVILQPDGAIVAGANSYVDETSFDAYCTLIGQAITSYSDDLQETAVIKSCQYINSLPFSIVPDAGKYAKMKFPQGGIVPEVVIDAQLWLAVKLLLNPELKLYNDTSSSEKIKQEVTGPISTTYFSPNETGERETGVRFDYIDNVLGGLLSDGASGTWIGVVA